jgi:hypothetical protein
MTAWICATCGVQHAETDEQPGECPICLDERQYVGWGGQRWLTMTELAADHHNEFREEEPGLTGFGTTPGFAIGQRSLLLRTDAGNVMWDGISLLDDATVATITDLGGIHTICCSHAHRVLRRRGRIGDRGDTRADRRSLRRGRGGALGRRR